MAESGGVRAISSPSPYASGMPRENSATPTLIGLPYDASSSFLRGAAAAPPVIRQALHSPAGNSWTETGVDIGGGGAPPGRGGVPPRRPGAGGPPQSGGGLRPPLGPPRRPAGW